MDVKNDAFARANREIRRAGANDRIVELKKPMGMQLDEDKDGNVFVASIEKGGRAERSGVVFVGDYVRMVSATFGEDMWTCRNVGLTRVVSCINMRNTKPVRLVLEAATPEEEMKRRAIAFKEPTPEELAAKKIVSK
jgi:C-terminal processing protease CtpA/Prc